MPKLTLYLKGRTLKTLEIDQPELTIGRDPSDDMCIDNIGISRSHVKIRVTSQGDIYAMDNQSRNGTFINDKKIESRHKLMEGDTIQLAKYKIVFTGANEPINLQKIRENAKRSIGKPKPQKSIGSQGTLSFSPDEIQNIIKAGDHQPTHTTASSTPQQKKKASPSPVSSNKGQNQTVLVMGLVIIILLLLLILIILIKRL